MTVLRARDLRKAHGEGRGARVVLDGVDLEGQPGELVAVVGRSGSGKSALLHLLGGSTAPTMAKSRTAGVA